MADEEDSQGADAAEAFEAMRGELALLRRAVEGLAAERGAIDMPDYSETLGVLQQGTTNVIHLLDLLALHDEEPIRNQCPETQRHCHAIRGRAVANGAL